MNRAVGRVFRYDFSVHGGAVGTVQLTQPFGPLPDDFVIRDAWFDVITALASGGAATGALTSGEGANDLISATAVSGAPWSTTGRKQCIPDWATVADSIKTTEIRNPSLVIATADLTAGKFNLYMEGVISS